MSHIDEWARFVLITGIVAAITLPIWIVPYGVWWLVKHEDWERDEKEREDRYKACQQAHPPKIVKPKVWSSVSEKTQWITDHPDIE